MKRFFVFCMASAAIAGGNAAVLRVNNAANTSAQFSKVADALGAAQEGDVIILEPSSTSYGDFDVKVKVKIKGGGYYIGVNDVSYEGASSSKAGKIAVYNAGTEITGLECDEISLGVGANDVVITRNNVRTILLGGTFGYDITEENALSGVIIHQNKVCNISGPQYGAAATGIQVTNNIIPYSYGNEGCVRELRNSVIKYNTYGSGSDGAYRDITNSVFEYNMGGKPEDAGKTNTCTNNNSGTSANDYGSLYQILNDVPDYKYKEVDAAVSANHGAFAGDTPYVLSGVPSGPVIIDLELPNSVTQGEDLKVSVSVGIQK